MRKLFYCFAIFLWVGPFFGPPLATAITADRTCRIDFSGEGCIFDLKAAANGTLKVCTKAGTGGVRWRATTAQINTPGALSNVGTGSTTTCSGGVQQEVVSGVNYEVLVTYERPLPGNFPTAVTVHFDGPFNSIPAPRPRSLVELKTCKQITELSAATAVDVESIACGNLVECRLDPSADTDSFTFTAPANGVVNIKIAGPPYAFWNLFDPGGNLLTGSYGDSQAGPLPVSGTYTIKTASYYNYVGDYTLSLQGICASFRCGSQIEFGDLSAGTLEKAGDADAFHFSAKKDQVVSIKIVGPPYAFWNLFDPGGNLLTGSYGESQSGPLPVSGIYTIKTASYYNYVGDYTLSLQKVGGP